MQCEAAEEPCGTVKRSRAATPHQESRDLAGDAKGFFSAKRRGNASAGGMEHSETPGIAGERRSREKSLFSFSLPAPSRKKCKKNGERDGTRTRNIHRDRVAL